MVTSAPTPDELDAARAFDAGPGTGSGPTLVAPDGGPARQVAFRKLTLHREFRCEGTAAGDIDGDGATDVVAGPHWYAGPSFATATPIWSAEPANVRGYSNCFFQWTRDFDRDGALDVLVVGFPGEDASWFENPGGGAGTWTRHLVVTAVDMESPEFLDLTGDGEPELLFASGGRLGWAGPDADPAAEWVFHPLTDARGFGAFGHGLGATDVDGDGRLDVLEASAWWQQPASLAGEPVWQRHAQAFGAGGGQMAGADLDGDGDRDVVATLAAHGYGLAFYAQRKAGGAIAFDEHVAVPNAVPAADAPAILHEPHALALTDIDGDGLPDVITGERFWGHVPEGMPDFDAPAHLYWFRLERGVGIAQLSPQLIDSDSGIGTQITAADLDGDARIDIAIANKKGAFVFLQQ